MILCTFKLKPTAEISITGLNTQKITRKEIETKRNWIRCSCATQLRQLGERQKYTPDFTLIHTYHPLTLKSPQLA